MYETVKLVVTIVFFATAAIAVGMNIAKKKKKDDDK